MILPAIIVHPRNPGKYRNWDFHGVWKRYVLGVQIPNLGRCDWMSRVAIEIKKSLIHHEFKLFSPQKTSGNPSPNFPNKNFICDVMGSKKINPTVFFWNQNSRSGGCFPRSSDITLGFQAPCEDVAFRSPKTYRSNTVHLRRYDWKIRVSNSQLHNTWDSEEPRHLVKLHPQHPGDLAFWKIGDFPSGANGRKFQTYSELKW